MTGKVLLWDEKHGYRVNQGLTQSGTNFNQGSIWHRRRSSAEDTQVDGSVVGIRDLLDLHIIEQDLFASRTRKLEIHMDDSQSSLTPSIVARGRGNRPLL
jgi:hypothetical protein